MILSFKTFYSRTKYYSINILRKMINFIRFNEYILVKHTIQIIHFLFLCLSPNHSGLAIFVLSLYLSQSFTPSTHTLTTLNISFSFFHLYFIWSSSTSFFLNVYFHIRTYYSSFFSNVK